MPPPPSTLMPTQVLEDHRKKKAPQSSGVLWKWLLASMLPVQ